MGTGSFPGVKRPGRGADHPPPSKCRSQERVRLYLYSPSGPSWPVMGAPLPFTLGICNKRILTQFFYNTLIELGILIWVILEGNL